MELIKFHFSASLDFSGQLAGWCEVENFPGFGVGEAFDHAVEITKKENRRKWKLQSGLASDETITEAICNFATHSRIGSLLVGTRRYFHDMRRDAAATF